MTNEKVPAKVKTAFRQLILNARYDNPDREIKLPTQRYQPMPTEVEPAHRRARKLAPVWLFTRTDNGTVIEILPCRELYDAPALQIYDLTLWNQTFGDGSHSRPKREKRPETYKVDTPLTIAEQRKIVRKMFPRMPRKIRKQFFSAEFHDELMKHIACMADNAVLEKVIHDCVADREDYMRLLEYRSYYAASLYTEGKRGEDSDQTATLMTYVKKAIKTVNVDIQRSRFALKNLGDVFTVPISYASESDESQAYVVARAEALEGGFTPIREIDEQIDIATLEAYVERFPELEKVYNLLVRDGRSYSDAARQLEMPLSTFRDGPLQDIRKVCRRFGFAPKGK